MIFDDDDDWDCDDDGDDYDEYEHAATFGRMKAGSVVSMGATFVRQGVSNGESSRRTLRLLNPGGKRVLDATMHEGD